MTAVFFPITHSKKHVNNMKKLRILLVFLAFFFACAGTAKHVKIRVPPAPEVLPVEVRNRSVSGKDLDNVITNHINAWKYIEELRRLGGFR